MYYLAQLIQVINIYELDYSDSKCKYTQLNFIYNNELLI